MFTIKFNFRNLLKLFYIKENSFFISIFFFHLYSETRHTDEEECEIVYRLQLTIDLYIEKHFQDFWFKKYLYHIEIRLNAWIYRSNKSGFKTIFNWFFEYILKWKSSSIRKCWLKVIVLENLKIDSGYYTLQFNVLRIVWC